MVNEVNVVNEVKRADVLRVLVDSTGYSTW